MNAKGPAIAVVTAVLLAITTAAAPLTAFAANESEVLASSNENSVSENLVSSDFLISGSDMDIWEQDMLEENMSSEEAVLSENDFVENTKTTDTVDEQEQEQDWLDVSLRGAEERQNEEEEILPDTEDEAPLDLMDQETLDKALAEGLVECLPNEEENVNEEYSRAGASGSSIVEIASREVGVSGCPNKYTYWFGSIGGGYAYAWCHAFVSWCGSQAGAAGQVPRTASCFYGVQEFKARGKWKSRISGYVPKAGDIIYFDWNANGGYDHVGIVNYVSAGRVHTIEGNAGNAVRYDGGRAGGYSLTDSQIIGYGTPDYGIGSQIRGCLDSASGGTNCVNVRGWAFDGGVPGQALDVHVYVGGPAGSGAPGYAIKANKSRPDVGAAYPGAGDNHGFDASITVSRTGYQPVFVYAIRASGKGDNPLIGAGGADIQADTQKPVISDVKVSDISVEGYTVTCKVSDNVGIQKVAFPSWHSSKTGNEAMWFEGAVKNKKASCFIPLEQLGNLSGKYTTHIYAYDRAGNYSVAAAQTVTIDHMDLRQYKTQNISSGFIAAIENESGKTALTGQEDSSAVTGRANDRTEEQIWEFKRVDDGSYSIRLNSDGRYLGFSAKDESVFLSHEAKEQRWHVYAAGDDSYYLGAQSAEGRVLELEQTEGDAEAFLRTFYALAGQRFKIRKLSTNVKSISLNHTEISMTAVGQTMSLLAAVKPKEAADEKICWKSSNDKIASVDKNGLVMAVDNGTAQITAATEDGSISVSCKVMVKLKVTGVQLNKQQLKFTAKGEGKKLSAKVIPGNAYNQKVTWESSDKKVAKVSQSGKVTAVSSGTAVITAQTADGKKTAACKIIVGISRAGAGGVVQKGLYTYSADFIPVAPDYKTYKTVIYQQKKGGAKKKAAQIGAKAYLKLIYGKNLYYEKTISGGKRNLCAMNTNTFKKKSIRANATITDNYGRYFLLKPYSAKTKPQAYRIWNAVTGKTKKISAQCLAAEIVQSKVYYAEALSGSAGKGWKVRVCSCNFSGKKTKYLTGKITINDCEKLTGKAITYRSGKSWYQYSFASKKRKKINF